MQQYRITKYDPQYRVNGVYEGYEWTSASDVGETFEDGLLTREVVEETIAHYAACAIEVLEAAGVPALTVAKLELYDQDLPWRDGQSLPLQDARPLMLDCLYERCWCMLEAPGAFVHFGYDLYMYVGCDVPWQEVRVRCARHGLFAESFASPYGEAEEAASRPIFLSVEGEAPAATLLAGCFGLIESGSQVTSLAPYTDALDEISVIPFCVTEDFLQRFPTRERRHISWQRRSADIRLRMDFDGFVKAEPEERLRQARAIIRRSLEAVKARCDRQGLRFNLDALCRDLYAEDSR